ncbi:MAG TPA: type I restriction enzyme HsdR N-terminal domain-containing protein [Thermoanaerobaculia bacterium]|nr:type I restriction enzyme HsdR N-terminal domain-containing protein [Thermoanaerobaculia bacterium]
MASVPKRVADRLTAGLKRYQPVLDSARSRDVNESDTSMIVSDMLADVFGYDKYNEITRELCVRGTYCDLAVRIDQKFQFLIEVKAVGVELKEQHVKQAVDYAANQGIEWVALTNGVNWKVFRVSFGKPIDKELVVDLNLPLLSGKNEDDVARLFLLSRENIVKSALEEYHDQKQATNKFVLAAAILSDPVLDVVRRQLRRMSPDLRVETDDLRMAISQDVLKREVIEGDHADQARKKLARAANRMLRVMKSGEESESSETTTAETVASPKTE